MTPWYVWALFIGGPFICAGAGAWVMNLFDRRWVSRQLLAEWEAGAARGYQLAQHERGSMVPVEPSMLIEPGHFGRHAGHKHYCPSCDGDAAIEQIVAAFAAVRLDLASYDVAPATVDDLWPAGLLATTGAQEVIP